MITIKIGGSVVDGLHPTTISDIKKVSENEKLIIVHGGGKEVTKISEALGKEQKFIVSPGGIKSRFTDKETAEIFTMVMSGKINKMIVGMLQKHGINAVGLSGIDGKIIQAERKKKLIVMNEKGRKMVIDGSSPTTSWEIDGETVETVSDFIFLGSKITTDGDCSHEIKRCLLLGRKVMTNLDSILKSRDITLPTKVRLVKVMVFPVVMYGCESRTVKKAES